MGRCRFFWYSCSCFVLQPAAGSCKTTPISAIQLLYPPMTDQNKGKLAGGKGQADQEMSGPISKERNAGDTEGTKSTTLGCRNIWRDMRRRQSGSGSIPRLSGGRGYHFFDTMDKKKTTRWSW